MKRLHAYLTAWALLTASALLGQFGNEWINHSFAYWSVEVAEQQVVQLSYEDLAAAGALTGPVFSDEIKVYGRGLQQKLWMQDGGDGSFDPGDVCWFLGRPNDGWLDAQIYDSPENHLHPNYSLFNDTARYFISVHTGVPERVSSQNPDNLNDLTPEPYGWQQSRVEYHDVYHIGRQDQYGIALPWHESGEGWGALSFSLGQTFTTSVPTPQAYTGSDVPAARIYTTSVGSSLAPGNPNHHLQVGSGNTTAIDTSFYGFQANHLSFDVPGGLGANTSIFHRSVNDLGVATDFQAVVSVEVDYPRNWTAPSGMWSVDVRANPGTALARVDIPGWDGSGFEVFTARLDLQSRLQTEVVDGSLRIPVPLVGGEATLLFVPVAAVATSPQITPVNGTGYFTDYSSAPDSAFVIVSPLILEPAANSYAFYRESQGTPVLKVIAEDLYDQFTYGIQKHPLAIRRLMQQLLQQGEVGPAHLFLCGKSVHDATISGMTGSRQDPDIYAQNLLPTWGWPASDLTFTAGLNGTQNTPAFPTGRIAARTTEEVLDYLSKVMEFENVAPAAWQKRILHFGGGGNTQEQSLFREYLEAYAFIAEDSLFGADIRAFYKSTSDPIQLQLGDSITDLISDGCALMTFFGHASATGFDQNIDSPSNYTNQGRYPLLIGNSCYTGNIHLADGNSTSERFTRVADAGVIGFIAKGDVGIPGYLNIWTETFYRQVFQEDFGTTIGRAMLTSALAVEGSGSVNLAVNTAMTFSLHGDPSLKLYHREHPDYSLSPSTVFTKPEVLTTAVDSFDVFVVIDNLGMARNVPVGVELIRTLPDGADTSLTRVLDQVFFRDTAVFRLPIDRLRGPGENQLDIFVDYPASLVDELDDVGNNTVQNWPFFVTASNVLLDYPYAFSILPEPPEELVVSTGDPFDSGVNLLIEVAETSDFTGPTLQQGTVYSFGGVIRWSPPQPLQSGKTYFWRASLEPVQGEPEWWSQSFRVEDGTTGFGQHHPAQFAANYLNGLEFTTPSTLSYSPQTTDLKCTVHGSPTTTFDLLDTNYQLGLDVMDYAGCSSSPALHVAVMDSVTLEPWETNYAGANPENDFDNLMACSNARARTERYFIFRQNQPSEMAGLLNLLENEIPNGHHLLIYTWDYATYTEWDANAPELFDVLTNLGFGSIGQSQDSIPFIGYVQVGSPETAQEVLGSSATDVIELELSITGSVGSGTLTTPWMGWGEAWQEGTWQFTPTDSDSVRVEVRKRDTAGVASTAGFYNMPLEPEDLSGQLANATHIQLRAELWDPNAAAVSQPEFWQVTSAHLPDAAVSPGSGFYQSHETLQAGEMIGFSVAVENTSPHAMDSLLVRYWVEGGDGIPQLSHDKRLDSLRVGSFLQDTVWFNTSTLAGNYTWWMEVNPIVNDAYDQREQHRFNNTAFRSFSVEADGENPLLDVSFDGRHIMDGELVSPLPDVRISLRDGSDFLLMDQPSDTARFKLFLQHPDGAVLPLYFSQTDLEFFPATGADNRAEARWKPHLQTDGTYQLIVQAEDRSGNSAGPDFRIHFEVESEAAITHVMNYPNPFTSSTRFVFTLTGVEVPDELVIQIFTVSGKVVREITQYELGTLRIGPNLTEYAWDGTDEFGDPLATGVYLYRVIARSGGQDLNHRSSDADAFFQKGIGKMYLIRQ